jgi:hypothetical protein
LLIAVGSLIYFAIQDKREKQRHQTSMHNWMKNEEWRMKNELCGYLHSSFFILHSSFLIPHFTPHRVCCFLPSPLHRARNYLSDSALWWRIRGESKISAFTGGMFFNNSLINNCLQKDCIVKTNGLQCSNNCPRK